MLSPQMRRCWLGCLSKCRFACTLTHMRKPSQGSQWRKKREAWAWEGGASIFYWCVGMLLVVMIGSLGLHMLPKA